MGSSATLSYAQSTFTNGTWGVTANGATTATLTLTVRGADGVVQSGRGVTFTVARTFVDAATCTLETDADEIATTSGTANITAHVYDADGTPLPGIPAASLSLASTGSGNTITAVDSVTDRNGRFRWTFSSTSAAAKTLTLTACGIVVTDTAAVTVTGTPGLPTLDWFSDYSVGGAGTSATAYQDGAAGGKWPGSVSNAGGLEVIASAGLDFPSTNVLQVTAIQTPGTGFHRCRQESLTIPAENASAWIRFYTRVAWDYEASGGDNSNHPIEAADTGDGEEWTFLVQNISAGVWRPRFRSMSDIDATPAGVPNSNATTYFEGPNLSTNTTYRFELQIERLTGDEFHMHVRVYNSSNVLIAEDADFTNANGTGNLEEFTTAYGTYSIGDRPVLHLASGASAPNLATIGNGLNGAGGTVWYPSRLFAYQGCFAHSVDTWCGAYDAGNG